MICTSAFGLLLAQRGNAKAARGLLTEAEVLSRHVEHLGPELYKRWGLLLLDELEGKHDAVVEGWHALFDRWERSEDQHYILAPLLWGASYFAAHGNEKEVRTCAAVLSRLAAETGNREALATLAHVLAEVLLLDGDAHGAALHFEQALAGWRDLHLVPLQARTLVRAAAALVAAGDAKTAAARLADGHAIAKRLDAKPLLQQIAAALALLEAGDGRQVQRVIENTARGGLSRRELEIMRLVAAGHTNREIANNLFLSTRTVDMHVRHILGKLDCRSRAEATRRAGEIGLLA